MPVSTRIGRALGAVGGLVIVTACGSFGVAPSEAPPEAKGGATVPDGDTVPSSDLATGDASATADAGEPGIFCTSFDDGTSWQPFEKPQKTSIGLDLPEGTGFGGGRALRVYLPARTDQGREERSIVRELGAVGSRRFSLTFRIWIEQANLGAADGVEIAAIGWGQLPSGPMVGWPQAQVAVHIVPAGDGVAVRPTWVRREVDGALTASGSPSGVVQKNAWHTIALDTIVPPEGEAPSTVLRIDGGDITTPLPAELTRDLSRVQIRLGANMVWGPVRGDTTYRIDDLCVRD